ncbi:MAG: phosphatase PAP2 family protein [Thermoanaerobaculia bacterium]
MGSLGEGLQPRRSGGPDRGFRAPRIALALAIAIALPLHGDESLLHRTINDVKDLATAPVHWKHSQWMRFGEGVALIGATMALDKPILDAVQRNRTSATDRYFTNVTHLGGGYGLDVGIALLLGGVVARNERLRDTGFDALESSMWAAGVVTPILKRTAGRYRPIQEHGTYSFKPFSNAESFPSGHATNAFALATAIAAHSDGYLVPTIAYTLATSVAIARVNDRVHFPSDVVAGALIGRAVAKSITSRHRALKHVMIVPAKGGWAVAVSMNVQ